MLCVHTLDPRCKKGLFVGHDKYSPSYLVYFPESNKVMKFGNVKFTERFENDSKPTLQAEWADNTERRLSTSFDNRFSTFSTRFDTPFDAFSTPFDIFLNFYGINDNIQYPEEVRPELNQKLEDNVPMPEVNEDIPLPQNVEAALQEHNEENVHNRYPERKRNKPNRLIEDFTNYVDVCYALWNVPNSYQQAIKSDEAQNWQEAMEKEIEAMKQKEVFSVVPLPKGKKCVGSRWVYTIKENPEGEKTYKARFVARGFSQVEGTDYKDTYSPTAKMTTIRVLMQVAIENDMTVHQLDVKTAYLNAPIDCEIYVRQPEGFKEENNDSTLVWRLNRSLYGLKQSGRNWNIVLIQFFERIGFHQSKIDVCLFYRNNKSGIVNVVVWVDDIIIAATSNDLLNTIKNLLKSRFNMKDLGPINFFLGIEFRQTSSSIEMHQKHYLENILKKFEMAECKPRYTPCESKPEAYEEDKDSNSDDNTVRKYREIVGSLVYAMTCSRPDLSWIVTRLSQHLANPSRVEWIMINQVLRYIKGTLDYKLTFKKSTSGLKIQGHSDSDWASSKEDRRSTTGFGFTMNQNGPMIDWKSRKQHTVALSSCEAEYMALTHATQEAMFLTMLSKDFNITTTTPIMIFGDNQGSLDMIKNTSCNDRSKHIDIKHHFIREKYNEGFINVCYIPTAHNVADLFTKPAVRVKLNKFHNKLFGEN